MPRNIEDIVIPVKKKSIRDIPIPENRRKTNTPVDFPDRRSAHTTAERANDGPIVDEGVIERRHAKPRGKRKLPGKKSLIAIGVFLVVVVFGILSLFSGATLAYKAKSAPITFAKDTYSAEKTGEGELLFSVVKLSGDKGIAVAANGEEEVTKKAAGTIIVYNNTGTAQKLIATTRFETPDGKVYRIPSAITVPARKSVNGATQPGSVEAKVEADKPGESFNIGLSDFTLPGLKGDPRYTTIYARSKTPMSGGMVGKVKKVDAATLAQAKENLESSLRTELMEQARTQVPEDFILFPSLASMTYEDLPQSNLTNTGATVNMKGNLYGVMFKRSDIANFLASKKTAIEAGQMVDIPNLENLNITFTGTPPVDLLKANQVNFTVEGQALAVWRTDEEALRADLIGKKKNEIESILKNYPSIESAETILRPFWKRSFPSNTKDINIKPEPIE